MFQAAGTSEHVAKHALWEHQPFYDCFEAFRDGFYVCFGFNLEASYHENVKNFAVCYEKLYLSITTKVHVLIGNVTELGFFVSKALFVNYNQE